MNKDKLLVPTCSKHYEGLRKSLRPVPYYTNEICTTFNVYYFIVNVHMTVP